MSLIFAFILLVNVNVSVVCNDKYSDVFDSLVNGSKKTVLAVNYATTKQGREIIFPSLFNALNRGVDVVIVLEQSNSKWNSDLTEDNKVSADSLFKHGIKVYFDSPGQITHCKILVVDTLCILIGSTNWTGAALNTNNEANLVIESKEIATEFTNYIEKIIKNGEEYTNSNEQKSIGKGKILKALFGK